jgi:hypothetical protein
MSDYYIWTGDGKLFIFREINLDPEEDQTIAFEDWYINNDIEGNFTKCSFNDIDYGEVVGPRVQVITPGEPWKESDSDDFVQTYKNDVLKIDD